MQRIILNPIVHDVIIVTRTLLLMSSTVTGALERRGFFLGELTFAGDDGVAVFDGVVLVLLRKLPNVLRGEAVDLSCNNNNHNNIIRSIY